MNLTSNSLLPVRPTRTYHTLRQLSRVKEKEPWNNPLLYTLVNVLQLSRISRTFSMNVDHATVPESQSKTR